ncbi:MAG: hypothetical protein K9K38_22005 [Rhodoferax sp.]|nr:hypothetical protein [Rhodoferax sp.]MCF8212052.1 hypothetical protein [Rhodoferax sp.]
MTTGSNRSLPEKAPKTRVILVANQPITLLGLETLLHGELCEIQVIAKTDNIIDAKRLVDQTAPDILLLDIALSGGGDVDFISLIVSNRRTRLLLLCDHREAQLLAPDVLKIASGLVHKEDPAHYFIDAIQDILGGKLWFDRRANKRLRTPFPAPIAAQAAPPNRRHSST